MRNTKGISPKQRKTSGGYSAQHNTRPIFLTLTVVILFFYSSLRVQGQTCTAEPTTSNALPGSNGTNFYNSGWYSSDPATIEYDNFVSSFHSTIIRQSDGTFKLWGALTAANGTGNLTSPASLNSTNYPAIGTSTPLKVAKAGQDASVLLTTDGLYAWGKKNDIFTAAVAPATQMQKITAIVGANTFSLPGTLTPTDVKMMTATRYTLAILTTSGSVYILTLSNLTNIRGDNSTVTNAWVQVKTDASTFLTNVIAVRVADGTALALRSDNTLWTWGVSNLGDATAKASRTFATQMTNPASGTIKMIAVTTYNDANQTYFPSYYVLYTDGNLYALGQGGFKQLGNWTGNSTTTWIQPRYNSATGPVMNDIKWISANEAFGTNLATYPGINVITNNKKLWSWGNNSANMYGGTATFKDPEPGTNMGLSASDNVIQVETGGHTSMILKECSGKFGYVGHYVDGSVGAPGGSIDLTSAFTSYNFTLPPTVDVIGAPPVDFVASNPTFTSTCPVICSNVPLTFTGSPSGGVFSISPGGTGAGTITSAGVLTITSPGTINVTYSGTGACSGSKTREYTFGTCAVDVLPVASNDVDTYTPNTPKTVAVLTNDVTGDAVVPATVSIVDGSNPDGSGDNLSKVVPGEGTWTVDPVSGAITFTPETGYTGNPTPISYTVRDAQGNVSNAATVTLTADALPVASNDVDTYTPNTPKTVAEK